MKEVRIGKRREWEDRISKKDFVLDIGCWSGKKLFDLSSQTKNLFGMDIDKSKFKLADPSIISRLKLADVTKKIPFKEKFDWIIFGEVLEHVSDDEKALENISNSLKVGGKLILTTPRHVKGFQMWDPAWFRWKFLGGQRHYHYTMEELSNKLEKNNLKIREYYITGNINWVIYRWITVFLNYVLKIDKKISSKKETKGFCSWIMLVEKIK